MHTAAMCERDRSDVVAITSQNLKHRQASMDLGLDEADTLLGYVRLRARAELVRNAREFVCLIMRSHGAASDAVDDAELIVSELVTNVVRHCGRTLGPVAVVELTKIGTLLRIEVYDASPLVPVQRTTDSGEEYGRGLTIVAALADQWGHDVTSEGKCVWCELTAWPGETSGETA